VIPLTPDQIFEPGAIITTIVVGNRLRRPGHRAPGAPAARVMGAASVAGESHARTMAGLRVGDTLPTLRREVTPERVARDAEFKDDDNPWYTGPSPWGGPVAPVTLTNADFNEFLRRNDFEMARRRVRADVAFPARRVAVFLDGCFWHRCPEHGNVPSANSAYWAPKLQKNVDRDRAVDAGLGEVGWRVVRVWEHVEPIDAVAEVRSALAT
jgi:DNA mismatch endonuclease (patch repair protein)